MIEYKLIDRIYTKYNTVIIKLKQYIIFNKAIFPIDQFAYFEINKQLFNEKQYNLCLSLKTKLKKDHIEKFYFFEKISRKYSNYIGENNYNIFLIYKNSDYGILIKPEIKNCLFEKITEENVNNFLIFLNNQETKQQII